MICRECSTPMMPVYSVRMGWREICVKCGAEQQAQRPAHVHEKAAQQAQTAWSAYCGRDFDAAQSGFLEAAKRCPRAPEYLWAALLARYGVGYCREEICRGKAHAYTANFWHREVPQTRLHEDADYEKLLREAGSCSSAWYRYYAAQAHEIDGGLDQLRALRERETAYDIFLCFKDTGADGGPTPERRLLDAVYKLLDEEGLRVFYAPLSMRGKVISSYAAYIAHALSTARLLVVVGSSRENVASDWVKNEWMRFVHWNGSEMERVMTGTVGGMAPEEFPAPLHSHQCRLRAAQVCEEAAQAYANGIQNQFLKIASAAPAKLAPPAPRPVSGNEPTAEQLYQVGVDFLEAHTAKGDADGFAFLQRAAGMCHAGAMNALGDCFYLARGTEKNHAEAVRWYRASAALGCAEAMYNLGHCYAYGRGVEKSEAQAVTWYQKAAEGGFLDALYEMGSRHAEGKGVSCGSGQAARYFYTAAKGGHARAQYRIAQCYQKGEGVGKNAYTAVMWYRKAALQGHEGAMREMGNCYRKGAGVLKNMTEAVKWYRSGAQQGDMRAQNWLGICLCQGTGVEQNVEEAVLWFRKAAEQMDEYAMLNLANCLSKGKGTRRNDAEAAKWYLQAAEIGNADAMNAIGVCYEEGRGVRCSSHRALRWYQKAADKHHAYANYNLGDLYMRGSGVGQDYEKAFRHFRIAAGMGVADAFLALAECYCFGLGTRQNRDIAERHYAEAAKRGSKEAQKLMARPRWRHSPLRRFLCVP